MNKTYTVAQKCTAVGIAIHAKVGKGCNIYRRRKVSVEQIWRSILNFVLVVMKLKKEPRAIRNIQYYISDATQIEVEIFLKYISNNIHFVLSYVACKWISIFLCVIGYACTVSETGNLIGQI
jgi:hypothetical protein